MKKINIALLSMALLTGATSCEDRLDVVNPNNPTTEIFGDDAATLNESVIAAYNHTRMEGTFARVGYMLDVCRGDEAWNSSQVWYLPFDNLTAPVTDEIGQWSYRDWFYTINVCNFILLKVETASLSENDYKEIKGQASFIRGMAYWYLATYYQTVPLIIDYNAYSTLDGLYVKSASQDEVLDQVEKDFTYAMQNLPSRDKGGEWSKGRATCGAAAGYLSRALMFRHKFSDALSILKDIIAGTYGTYDLVPDYGTNFRSGIENENNIESLYEVQYLDYGKQGTDDEWTPVNTSPNATQAHALESNFGPGQMGGWADISGSPWLYNLLKSEKTTDGKLDPRLYYTFGTYEPEYETMDGFDNIIYQTTIPNPADPTLDEEQKNQTVTNTNNGGIIVVKHTSARENLYNKIVTGLHCGVNVRLLRFADILLLAAEAENEVNGPTEQAFSWINRVRNRAGLADLDKSNFTTADALFEQIANVERPKELGCENGRGIDLIRWGFFYDANRLKQMSEHSAVKFGVPVITAQPSLIDADYDSYANYKPGHEYFPIYQGTLNDNPNLSGNSANENKDNSADWFAKGYKVRPVVE